jgi:hypothetical protein
MKVKSLWLLRELFQDAVYSVLFYKLVFNDTDSIETIWLVNVEQLVE